MRHEALEIKGVLRFRDVLRLDLRDLTGLVAVVGANGAGKTTFMETTPGALFRLFPSRADKELVDYAHDRDSYLSIDFTVEGRGLFRARVALDAVGRKSEAVLLQIHLDGTQTFLNDGKVSTYDAAIRELLPSPAVLLASAFAAQNRRGSFVTLDKRARKELFAILLGLGHYEEMASTARQSAAMMEQSRGRLLLLRDRLAREIGPEVAQRLDQQARAISEQQVAAADTHERLTIRLDLLSAEHTGARARVEAHAAALEAQRGCLAALQDLERAIAAVEVGQGVSAKAQRDALADIEAARLSQTTDLRSRIANNERLLTEREVIDAAVLAVRTHSEAMATLDAQMSAIRVELVPIERERDTLRETVSGQRQFQYALEHAEREAGLIGQVPCGGEVAFAACQFLTHAADTVARLTDLRVKVQGAGVNEARLEQLTQQVTARRERLDALQAERGRAEHMRTKAEPLAARADRLREADTRLEELRTSLAGVDAAALAQQQGVEQRAVSECAEQEIRVAELRLQLPARQAAVTDASARVQPLADAGGKLSQIERDQAEARAELARTETTIAVLATKTEAIERDRQALARTQAEHAAVVTSLTAVETEWLEWQALAKALGREGLPTLEIDAAGPTVSGYCNQLLEACFGGRFRVDLVTQEAKAGGKGVKEAFELKVLDNARGGDARDITDLSGGEQIIVDECLKSALAVYNNRRSVSPMRTCWRDETTGPLDADNAARYLAMLRTLRELAGFDTIFFVTHSVDAAITADAQIWVHDGTAEILFPPFGERQAAA